MRAILIDPIERSFSDIELPKDSEDTHGFLEACYKILDCHTIEFARCKDFDIIVDEEGMYRKTYGFGITAYPSQPLMGKGIVVAKTRDEGWCGELTQTADDIRDITWFPTFVGGGDAA